MGIRRLRERALRVKLGLLSLLTLVGSLSLLGQLHGDNVGPGLAEEAGWGLQAVLVAVAVTSGGLMFYLAGGPAARPTDRTSPTEESQPCGHE